MDLTSKVDPRFGRAKYFIIYDTETKEMEVVGNEQNFQAAQGAGVQSAQNVARLDVQGDVHHRRHRAPGGDELLGQPLQANRNHCGVSYAHAGLVSI